MRVTLVSPALGRITLLGRITPAIKEWHVSPALGRISSGLGRIRGGGVVFGFVAP